MENTNITHTVSAPVQTYTPNQEPVNPLDELTANIETMKAKLKIKFDESTALARKVREVAISQRQKERAYQQAKRAIERIRVATGAAGFIPPSSPSAEILSLKNGISLFVFDTMVIICTYAKMFISKPNQIKGGYYVY